MLPKEKKMSLYNMLFGANQAAPLLTAILDLGSKKWPIGRFRDAFVEKTEDGDWRIVLYTRNGGGNRECWTDDCKHDRESGCLEFVNENLTQHPNYIRDYDDDFDCTYAYFVFSVPAGFEGITANLESQDKPGKKWEKMLAALENKNENTVQEPLPQGEGIAQAAEGCEHEAP